MLANKKYFFQLIWLVPFFFISCKKDIVEVAVQAQQVSSKNSRINDIFFTPNKNGFLVAGRRFERGEIYKTNDNGQSWDLIHEEGGSIYDLYFLNDSVGFACGDWYLVLKTINGGDTWERTYGFAGLIDSNRWYNLKSVLFLNDSLGFIVGGQNFNSGMIGKTTNYGVSWDFKEYDNELAFIRQSLSGELIVGGNGLLMTSSDHGETYQFLDIKGDFFTGFTETSINSYLISGYDGGVYMSIDKGDSWEALIKRNGLLGNRQHFNATASLNDTQYYVVGNNGKLIVSKDAGNTWNTIKGFSEEHLVSIAIHDEQTFIGDARGYIYTLEL